MDRHIRRDRIAVFYVLSEEGRIHASVPYVSTLQHRSYPYHRSSVDLEPFINLGRVPAHLAPQYLSPHITGITAAEAARLADLDKPEMLHRSGFDRQDLIHYGREFVTPLHLDRITDFLFSLEDEVTLLQIFTDIPQIPWDWVYNQKKDRFLCEVFGIGITQHEEDSFKEVSASRIDDMPTLDELRSSEYCALIVGNSHSQQDRGSLPDMDEALRAIAEPVKNAFGTDTECTIIRDDIEHKDLVDIVSRITDRVRLIYLSGHFDMRGFLCGKEYFNSHDLLHAVESSSSGKFSANPVVFLNGCTSAGAVWFGYHENFMKASRALGDTFLKKGADACIITSAPVRFRQAQRFAEIFLRELLAPGKFLGSAIRSARMQLSREQYCYEWAVYHLFGDPSYVLVRED